MSNAAAGGAVAVPEAGVSEKEIVRRFQNMMAKQRSTMQKLAELDAQKMEYSRVASTIRPMDPSRKCYQLINQVLVERTLAEVVPIVEANLEGLTQVTKNISEDVQAQEQEVRDYQAKHNIRVVDPKQGRPGAGGGGASNTSGVLA